MVRDLHRPDKSLHQLRARVFGTRTLDAPLVRDLLEVQARYCFNAVSCECLLGVVGRV